MSDSRPTVLIVGTGHWANPGLDYSNPVFDDMLAPRRQAEIRTLVDRLKSFGPTRVAIEVAEREMAQVNDDYGRYRIGSFVLTASEYHQLGFRIAAELGHEQIYGVDWNKGTIGLDTVFSFAEEHQPELFDELQSSARAGGSGTVTGSNLLDLIRRSNHPVSLRRMHDPYLLMARVGRDDCYVGIDWVKGWYERNLIIYANLCRLLDDPSDRVLVVYGAGHVPLLTQFLEGDDRVALARLDGYLA